MAYSDTSQTSTLAIGARSDRGMQRSGNEDAFAVVDRAAHPLAGDIEAAFVVADGMGGLSSGDRASSETVRIVHDTLVEHLSASGGASDPEAALRTAVRRANDRVYALAQEAARAIAAQRRAAGEDAPTERGSGSQPPGIVMGTTVVAGVVQSGTLYVAHVGDSRAYLLRGGRLERLTRDHSFVEERVMAGDMTEAEARSSRFRNMITRAIGIDAEAVPDIRREKLRPGDLVLLCSDGLTTMLEDAQIEEVLNSPPAARASVDKTAQLLVDAANRAGGSDNITVVLLRAATGFDSPTETPAAFGGSVLTTPELPVTSGAAAAAVASGDAGSDVSIATPVGASAASVPPSSATNYDYDAGTSGRRRRSKEKSGAASPLIATFAAIGIASALFVGAVVLYDPLRVLIARSLTRPTDPKIGEDAPQKPGDSTETPGQSLPPRGDYTQLTYDKPQRFTDKLARGDLLDYVPGKGLVFVRGSTGTVALASPKGTVLQSITDLPDIAPPPPTPIPRSRNFMATDPQGNVYISFTARKVIEKYSASGQRLTTFKGFDRPEAVAVDEWGNIYVVDFDTIKVLRARNAASGGSNPASTAAPAASSASSAATKPKPAASATAAGQ